MYTHFCTSQWEVHRDLHGPGFGPWKNIVGSRRTIMVTKNQLGKMQKITLKTCDHWVIAYNSRIL
uniref:Uncharacterized protein n=1 Tax=Romanomermis culicivorax TaxID=13658 RepID=A0A915I1Q0_ROMCU